MKMLTVMNIGFDLGEEGKIIAKIVKMGGYWTFQGPSGKQFWMFVLKN